MTKIAEHHGVSSSFMARVCTQMNVPRPPRGHWAKLENGKPSPQPPLPEAGPGDLQVWRRGDVLGSISRPLPKAPSPRVVHPEQLRISRSKQHPMVVGAYEIFEQGRLIDQGFLKPGKQRLVDIVVTKQQLEPALKLANQLFLKLEAAGHRVMFAPSDRVYARTPIDEHEQPPKKPRHRYPALWSPSKPTVVFVGTVAIGLTLFEMTEELEARYIDGEYVPVSKIPAQQLRRLHQTFNWSTRMDFATGRLCIRAFCPYPNADWTHSWKEAKESRLYSQLDGIVQQITDAAPMVARLVEDVEERARVRQQKWEEEKRRLEERERLRRQIEARQQARSDLLNAIQQWDDIRRIQAFFRDVEASASELAGAPQRLALEKLAQARELIGELDALQALMDWKGPQ
ncbi:hypothetical protein [Pseudomonas aeruginosa]|uniref:hypothetical protein n=1 Tax=Pseudomonas aeruginosa TaxID=287 RepID=UPI001D197172|nr:hypothetical protein [Pseudomonas aeruginosa]MCC4281537.1 hypothetical protein [Pseudomonas aeruginosa]MEC4070399.1 hypothetical protein [Pseudomonas aeruginosa]